MSDSIGNLREPLQPPPSIHSSICIDYNSKIRSTADFQLTTIKCNNVQMAKLVRVLCSTKENPSMPNAFHVNGGGLVDKIARLLRKALNG